MMGQVVLNDATTPAKARCHTYTTSSPIGSVDFDGMVVQSQDPALLAELGAAFLLAAEMLANSIAEAAA